MTRNEALALLKALQPEDGPFPDIEAIHSQADAILCQLLAELGYGDVVEAWLSLPKWYA